jgi:hypothetical protein
MSLFMPPKYHRCLLDLAFPGRAIVPIMHTPYPDLARCCLRRHPGLVVMPAPLNPPIGFFAN